MKGAVFIESTAKELNHSFSLIKGTETLVKMTLTDSH